MSSLIALYLISFCVSHSYGSHKAIIRHTKEPLPILAIVSSYSSSISELNKSSGKLIYHSSDSQGCTEWQSINKDNASLLLQIGIVDRGTCTFLQKTKQAQLAGLDAIFIVSDDESMTSMGADETELKTFKQTLHNNNIILSVMVPLSLKKLCDENPGPDITIQISEYLNQIWDISMLIMVFMATALVGIGAYYSSDTERAKMNCGDKSNGLRRRASVQEINSSMAWCFIIFSSTGLLTLYFFVSKIFVIIVLIFCIGATNGLSTIFAHVIDYFLPTLQKRGYFFTTLDLEFTLSDLLGFIPAALLSIIWFLFRQSNSFAWILQNIMCAGLLLVMQRTIRLSNLKIASILLGSAFFYDIFWVFLSPSFFESSVMVSVATYQHNDNSNDTLPVVLKFPRLNDIFHSPMILGLGDIALPGLLISYLLRFDYQNKIDIMPCMDNIKNGYFLTSLIGYFVGMLLTDINLIVMQSGQPALLFLVPCTLGVTAIIAYKRGHFKRIWNGVSSQYKPTNGKAQEFLLKSQKTKS